MGHYTRILTSWLNFTSEISHKDHACNYHCDNDQLRQNQSSSSTSESVEFSWLVAKSLMNSNWQSGKFIRTATAQSSSGAW